jgi:hypothetical protein
MSAGTLLDPYEGARSMKGPWKIAGLLVGILKALLGLGARPTAGVIESGSKILQGLGLMCLGKRGIQGKLLRRVQAPGVPLHNTLGAEASGAAAAAAVNRLQLLTAWQAALPHIAPELEGDSVVDVFAARPSRTVLLTNRHLAYLIVKRHSLVSSVGALSL